MTAEQLIAAKASEAVKAIYGADIDAAALQVQPTRKEFEGDYTLVVFPLLKISRQAPDATGNAIGGWLLENCAEIAAFNSVKGFLNLSLSGVYWQEQLAAVSSDPEFGRLPSTGHRIMVEFSSPNTNKPLHLGAQGFVSQSPVGTGRVLIGQHVKQTVVLALHEGCVHAHMAAGNPQGVGYLVLGNVYHLGELLGGRLTLVLLLELSESLVYLVERTDLVEREPDDAALLREGLEYRLAYPPYGV